MSNKKILLYDLETTPNIGYSWGVFEQNIIEVQKNWELLSVAYKWLGDKEVRCLTRKGEKSDKNLTKKLWRLHDEADIVIAHNGDAFDNKKSNAKFIEHGLTPPSPYVSIDTLKLARRRFKFNSNRLNELGKLLGLGTKINTGGFGIWLGCMANDEKSWDMMVKYNKQDVALLEKVYLRLRPWHSGHPNMSERGLVACPKCRSTQLQRRGFNYTKAAVYQQFACLSCGGWARAQVTERGAKKHLIVNG